jgi:hypothetical protein
MSNQPDVAEDNGLTRPTGKPEPNNPRKGDKTRK